MSDTDHVTLYRQSHFLNFYKNANYTHFYMWFQTFGYNCLSMHFCILCILVSSVPVYQIWDTKLSQMQTPLTLFALIYNRQHVKMNFNFTFSFIQFKSAVAALISHPLKDKSHKILFCKCKELWVIHPFYY